MNYTIYHNPRCSKSRAALQLLEENGINPTIRLYLKEPLSKEELKQLMRQCSLNAEDLVRKKEQLFKENYADKAISDGAWLDILAANPVLIERPIVCNGKRAVIGRPTEKVMELI